MSTKNTKTEAKRGHVSVKPLKEKDTDIEYDESNVVITKPKKIVYQNGRGAIYSEMYYTHEGKEEFGYLSLPKQGCWGVAPFWPMEMPPDEQTLANIKGYQVAYPATSIETKDEPTEAEAKTIEIFEESLPNVLAKCLLDNPDWYDALPKAQGLLLKGDSIEEIRSGIKPILAVSKSDKSKDKRKKAYIPLIVYGKEGNQKIMSKIYGPGDKLINPTVTEGVRCDITPVVKLGRVFWGSHGETDYAASFKFVIQEANLIPGEGNNMPTERLGERVTIPDDGSFSVASLSKAVDEAANSSDGEGTTMDGDSTNPRSLMKKKTSGAKPAPPKPGVPKSGTAKPTIAPKAGTAKPKTPATDKPKVTTTKPAAPKPTAKPGVKSTAKPTEKKIVKKPAPKPKVEEPTEDNNSDGEVAADD